MRKWIWRIGGLVFAASSIVEYFHGDEYKINIIIALLFWIWSDIEEMGEKK